MVLTLDLNPDLSAFHRALLKGIGEIIALSLVHGETSYGVLTVYATEADRFDKRDRSLLCALARAASTAINAIESRRILTTDNVVELELSITDQCLCYRDIAETLGATLTYEEDHRRRRECPNAVCRGGDGR